MQNFITVVCLDMDTGTKKHVTVNKNKIIALASFETEELGLEMPPLTRLTLEEDYVFIVDMDAASLTYLLNE